MELNMPTESEQMQIEWRSLVIAKLNALEVGQSALANTVNDIKTNAAQATEVKELREEINSLKLWKAKVIGVLVAVNAVVLIAGWAIQSYLIAKH